MEGKKRWYMGGILVLIGLVIGVVAYLRMPDKEHRARRCCQGQCFSLEVADKPETRAFGLMYRKILATHRGMLFVFPDERMHDFWMKNTLIPLDMIWFSSGYIIDIQEAIPCAQDPCKIYHPVQTASYVIELLGGTAKKIGIHSGLFCPPVSH